MRHKVSALKEQARLLSCAFGLGPPPTGTSRRWRGCLSRMAPPPLAPKKASTNARILIFVLLAAIWQGMIGVWVKWVDFPPLAMVSLRCAIAAMALWLVIPRRAQSLAALLHGAGESGAAERRALLSGGVLMAGHWGFLFLAYRISDIAPVVIGVFTYPIMASLLEPLARGARPQVKEVASALVAGVGIAFMALRDIPESSHNGAGLALGLLSGLCFALRGISTKKLMTHHDAITVMFVQVCVVALLLSPSLLFVSTADYSAKTMGLIALIGVAFTALPHTVMVWSWKRLTVASSGVVGSVQVVSSLVLAALLVGENVPPVVWGGAALVLSAVVFESLRS